MEWGVDLCYDLNMKEETPNIIEGGESGEKEKKEKEKEARRTEKLALAAEIIENREFFSFPGVDPDVYLRMKAKEEEFPGYATPIDDLIKKFTDEGMKVAFVQGDSPGVGNVFVLPEGSNDIENDSILPCKLRINETMDEKLKKLILLDRD